MAEKVYDTMKDAYTVLKTSEEIKEELEKAKKINPEDTGAFKAFQMTFSSWLLSKIPNPVSMVFDTTTPVADATITKGTPIKPEGSIRVMKETETRYGTDTRPVISSGISVPAPITRDSLKPDSSISVLKSLERRNEHTLDTLGVRDTSTEDMIMELHELLKENNLYFDTSKDMIIYIDNEPAYKVPKETMVGLDYVQKFVHSAELVYNGINDKSMADKFKEIKKGSKEFHDYMNKAQNVKVEFTIDPKSFGEKMAEELGKVKETTEKLYKTPRTETTMSSVSSSYTTTDSYAKPHATVSNSGGSIAIAILIPIITIPFGGGAFGAGCKIL